MTDTSEPSLRKDRERLFSRSQRLREWFRGDDLASQSDDRLRVLGLRWWNTQMATGLTIAGSLGVLALDFYAGNLVDTPREVVCAGLLVGTVATIITADRLDVIDAEQSRRLTASQKQAEQQVHLARLDQVFGPLSMITSVELEPVIEQTPQ